MVVIVAPSRNAHASFMLANFYERSISASLALALACKLTPHGDTAPPSTLQQQLRLSTQLPIVTTTLTSVPLSHTINYPKPVIVNRRVYVNYPKPQNLR